MQKRATLSIFCALWMWAAVSSLECVRAQAQQADAVLNRLPTQTAALKGKKSAFVAAPAAAWAPPDVEASVPEVDPAVPCSLPLVLQEAGKRTQQLINDLTQFTATEQMQHYELDRASGQWGKPTTVDFDYLVEMKKLRSGMLYMDETRDGGSGLFKFPAHLATTGLPAVAMVFHPFFVGDYDMKCEGRSQWDGHPAWQVYFQQRRDKFPRLRGYRVKDQTWGVKLRGRAWVDAETFQPLHIETDIMDPVPQIMVFREHLAVDYRPVHFVKQNEDLWLQQRAEIFMDYRGHRYRRVHTFSNFLLFSVDVGQQDKAPKEQ